MKIFRKNSFFVYLLLSAFSSTLLPKTFGSTTSLTELSLTESLYMASPSELPKKTVQPEASPSELPEGVEFYELQQSDIGIGYYSPIQLILDGEKVIEARTLSTSPYTFYYNLTTPDNYDHFSIAALTSSKNEFYYGNVNEPNSLTPFTEVLAERTEDGELQIFPVAPDGSIARGTDLQFYNIHDTLHQFSLSINSIVNEHSEDNGDVYLWQGTEYYPILNSETGETGTQQLVSEALTEIRLDSKITVRGRIGDSFTVSEAPFSRHFIYAVEKASYTFNDTWYEVSNRNASDGGNRIVNYKFKDYLKLNSFRDKVDYFEIQAHPQNPKQAQLWARLPNTPENTTRVYPVQDLELMVTRSSVVNLDTLPQKLSHIQLRIPANIQLRIQGVSYSGTLTLKSANGSWDYKRDENSIQSLALPFSLSPDSTQESNMVGWGDTSLEPDIAHRFDAQRNRIRISYEFVGQLKSEHNDTILFTEEKPFRYTEEHLDEERLRQSFNACPNKSGYDVMVDLTSALKTQLDPPKDPELPRPSEPSTEESSVPEESSTLPEESSTPTESSTVPEEGFPVESSAPTAEISTIETTDSEKSSLEESSTLMAREDSEDSENLEHFRSGPISSGTPQVLGESIIPKSSLESEHTSDTTFEIRIPADRDISTSDPHRYFIYPLIFLSSLGFLLIWVFIRNLQEK